jgi:hypothetical protein
MSKIYVDEIAPKTAGADITLDTNILTPNRPAFQVSSSNNAWTTLNDGDIVPFNISSGYAGLFDIGGNFNTSAYAFTAPIDGIYQFNLCLFTLESNTQSRFIVLLNGSGITMNSGRNLRLSTEESTAGDTSGAMSFLLSLSSGDQIKVKCDLNSSDVHPALSHFSGYLIG